MKKRLVFLLTISLLLLPFGSAFATEAILVGTETLQWDPDAAYNGYNAMVNGGVGYLLDMEGKIVNSWEQAEGLTFRTYFHPLETGKWRMHLAPSYAPRQPFQSGGASGRLEEYTWEGERTWWWDALDGVVPNDTGGYTNDASLATFRFHHDWQYMYNPILEAWTYLVLIWVGKGQTDAENLGPDSSLGTSYQGDGATWSPCGMIEVLPKYDVTDNSPLENDSAEIVWYWTFADHMVTTDPGGTAITEPWTDWSGRTAMPAVVVSSTDGDTDSIRANPGKLDVNGIHNDSYSAPRTDYQHCNSIDYDETTGYIAINAKACSEFFVVDHDGTFVEEATHGTFANGWDTNAVGALAREAGGDFLYRFGSPRNYYSGDPPGWRDHGDSEMYGCHDIQFINPYHWRQPFGADDDWTDPASFTEVVDEETDYLYDLSGAGHFLIFDNSCYNPMIAEGSHVLEINPYIMAADGTETETIWEDDPLERGNRVMVDPSAYGVNSVGLDRRDQVVYDMSKGVVDFYGNHISGTTRMPNGNTIVCSGTQGHLFEVGLSTGGRGGPPVVWEYVVPTQSGGAYQPTKTSGGGTFRFYRFSADWPALAGKDLTPGLTLVEMGTGITTFDRMEDALRDFRTGAQVVQ